MKMARCGDRSEGTYLFWLKMALVIISGAAVEYLILKPSASNEWLHQPI